MLNSPSPLQDIHDLRMSSLRLALKKSLEENPLAAQSASKSYVFDHFYDISDAIKTTKSTKKRRASSIDGDTQNKKIAVPCEDSTTNSLYSEY